MQFNPLGVDIFPQIKHTGSHLLLVFKLVFILNQYKRYKYTEMNRTVQNT